MTLPNTFYFGESGKFFSRVSGPDGSKTYLRAGDGLERPSMGVGIYAGDRLVGQHVLALDSHFYVNVISTVRQESLINIRLYSDKIEPAIQDLTGGKNIYFLFFFPAENGVPVPVENLLFIVEVNSLGLQSALDHGKQVLATLLEDHRQGRCEVPKRTSGGSGGGCFLTTAACELHGRPDDCWELNALRRFRDEALPHMPGGDGEIREYYEVSPRILDRLSRAPAERRRELRRVYALTVLPCALLVRLKAHRLARALYRHRVRRLKAAYLTGRG